MGVLEGSAVTDFLDQWQHIQRSLSMDAYEIHQKVQHPGQPLKTHMSIRSDVVRSLAQDLRERGVAPGRFRGEAAVDFENSVYQVLKSTLQDSWSQFSPRAVLLAGMNQLERASAKREHQQQHLYFNVTRLQVTYDPITRSVELQQEASRLTRAITTILELVLRDPRAGETRQTQFIGGRYLQLQISCLSPRFEARQRTTQSCP
jgi:hypothetical protein